MFDNVYKRGRYFLVICLFLLCGFNATFAQLQANFTVDQAAGCSPLLVSFTNNSTGISANASFHWDFGNGNTSALKNPQAIFIEEKNYDVILTVTDGAKTSSKTQRITVYKKPTVDFTANVIKGCSPLPVTLTSQSSAGDGTIQKYFWDFGDGSTQEVQGNSSAAHTYNFIQSTHASVRLTVTNNYGCYNTAYKESLIEVLPVIKAEFSANQTFICKINDPVTFTNTSVGPGTLSYDWDFGDGAHSSEKAPSYIFNKRGTYDVSLKVTSSEGCSITKTQTAYLNVGDFTSNIITPLTSCNAQEIKLVAESNPFVQNAQWDIPGYGAGYYNSPGAITYVLPDVGNYTARLIQTFGTCKDTVYKVIEVKATPEVAGFLNDKDIYCGTPQTVQFRDTSKGDYQYKWNFNYYYGSNEVHSTLKEPVYNFTSNGMYRVALFVTSKEGCTGFKEKLLNFSPPQAVIYQVSSTGPYNIFSGCTGMTVKYGVNPSRPIVKYLWTFSDDGTTSTEGQPSHTFTKAGTYTVTLQYETVEGCTGTTTYNNDIYNKPVFDFTVPDGQTICGNTPVVFKVISTEPYLNSYWDFGDGGSSYISYGDKNTVTHKYEQEGQYPITVRVYREGCGDTIVKLNYIKVLPPFPKITTYANSCADTHGEVTFKDGSRQADSWQWDFGDGSTSSYTASQPEIKHIYTKTGNYKVVLTTTKGQCAVQDSIEVPVLVKQQPLLTALQTEACNSITPIKITVDKLDLNPRYYVSGYYTHYFVSSFLDENNNSLPFRAFGTSIDFNLPSPGMALGVTDFPNNGLQQFKVVTTSTYFGCTDTSNYVTVKVKGPRAGYFVSPSRCLNQPTLFNDTSKGYNNIPITKWFWNFGDGPTQTYDHGGIIPHQYTSAYSYPVYLQVTDAEGCSSETRTSYLSITGIRADFSSSATTIEPNTVVNFTNTSFLNYYNEADIEYKWLLDNTVFATTKNASYNFTLPGVYTVMLVLSNPLYSCSDTMRQTITVKYVNSAFQMNAARLVAKNCLPVLVNFTNISSNAARVLWEFGDGSISDNNFNPSHLYNAPGKYKITLHVFSTNGTEYITVDSVIINQPQASLQIDNAAGCIGHTALFQTTNQFITDYIWDFGDGSVNAQQGNNTVTHQYQTPGNYTPSLILKGENGCLFPSVTGTTVAIHPDPVITISPAQPSACQGKPLQLNATGGVSYLWTPAEGLNNNTIASPILNPTVTATYKVEVTDDLGCKNEKYVTIEVRSPFEIHLNPTASICQGDALTLNASGANSYRWINNITGLDNTGTATPVARPATSTQYTVVGYDSYNCFTDTAQTNITVYPKPSVQASNDIEVLAGTPVPLSVSSADNIISWNWSPADYLSCTSCSSPVSIPKSEITYTVTGKDNNGCQASDQVRIKLQCEESRVAIPNGFTPNGDGKNDLFVVKGISYVKHLTIYNRWGNKIFERSNFIAGDASNCWDGTYKGDPQPEGSYVYFIEMQCPNGGIFTRRGTVTLLR